MRIEAPLFRPPSEASHFLLQATVGCSWNHCTFCAMYRHKAYRVRPLEECLEAIREAAAGPTPIDKVFVADGDALAMPTDHWLELLAAFRTHFPAFRRAACYATALNILEKSERELLALREAGLTLLFIGPESGDDVTLKRIAKGSTAADHLEAARRAKAAGMSQSLMVLLGVGGVERSEEHARGTAELITGMDAEYVSALTLTVVPFAPIARQEAQGKFVLPEVNGLLRELRTLVDLSRPTHALFRSNHASNYLPITGRLPRDREKLLTLLDQALAGEVPLRPEWARGL